MSVRRRLSHKATSPIMARPANSGEPSGVRLACAMDMTNTNWRGQWDC
jgi:hypothetical protein